MRRTGVLAGLAVALLLVTGCGSGIVGPTKAEKARAAAKLEYTQCKKVTADLRAALGEVNSRLDVGMTNADYGTKVGDVKVVYDALDSAKLTPTCVSMVAIELEDALTQYVGANNEWDRCIQSDYCSSPDLQDYWTAASKNLDTYDEHLEAMKKPAQI